MSIRTITKNEIRQFFNDNEAFLWFRETMNNQFDLEKRLLRAQHPETLWQLKGIAEVMTYINDIDKLLEHFEQDDDEEMPD